MKVLSKHHSMLDVSGTPGNWDFTAVPTITSNQGWTRQTPTVFTSETYFDLAGMAMEEQTIFPQGITVQRGSFPLMTGAIPGDCYLVWDYLTSIPLDLTDANVISQLLYVGQGYPGTVLNFEHVLYARGQRWVVDLDTAQQALLKADEFQFGSMSPTASDRIYSYRIVQILVQPGSTATQVLTSNARHLMQVDTKEEPLYQHLMRLKRSYDLQQQPDVD
jgi:hypothetical protein